jgi:LysR family glycine cleavage system transcriptional activator
MPGHHLPPLNALRAFEAVARHLSVKHAAAELCVTPGAVSQMLRVLEDHFGVRLFRRLNRGILLTDAGQSLLPPVRNAFRQISDAARRVTLAADTGLLTVSSIPFFAAAWLVPRLAGFQTLHPEIDLHVVTGTGLAEFARGSVDVAIRAILSVFNLGHVTGP